MAELIALATIAIVPACLVLATLTVLALAVAGLSSEDLDDPLGFQEGRPQALTDDEFDAALGRLLDEEGDQDK